VPASVLVVDDEPAALDALRRTLRNLPLEVRYAQNAVEALALVAAGVPDLLISDFSMPGMDGLALLQQVKQHHPGVICFLHTSFRALPSTFGVDIPVLDKACDPAALRQLVWSIVDEQLAVRTSPGRRDSATST